MKRQRAIAAIGALVAIPIAFAGSAIAIRNAEGGVPTLATPLTVVGYSDLGGGGLNGEVAVVGTTAVVGGGLTAAGGVHSGFYNPYPCPATSVKVVDISNPAAPTVSSTIPVPAGVAALDVAALKVTTPGFSGNLAAIALAVCSSPGSYVERGVHYYDVTDPAAPVYKGRYQADADIPVPPTTPPCGPPPGGSGARCASSQHSVSLVQRADGRVLSLSTEPFASASSFPSGDVRIVDVTNPVTPIQVGSFPVASPPGYGSNGAGFSNNGCRPFDAAHSAETNADGTLALVPYLDQGLMTVDLTNPSTPTKLGQFTYPRDNRAFEGNAAYATSASVGGRSLALVADEDWNGPNSSVRVDSPASLAGSKFACEAVFTLFDPEDTAQIFRKPGSEVPGSIVYVGRGCPVRGTTAEDPYLDNPSGKIALIDRVKVAAKQPGIAPAGCSFGDRVKRAQEAGALGVIFAQTVSTTPQAFGPDGVPVIGGVGLSIPAVQVDKGDGDAMREGLCPAIEGGNCTGGTPVTGAMVDSPGVWGGLRVLDVTDPANPVERGGYQTARSLQFPPPDLGSYSIHHAVAEGDRAYVAWNSDGLRVLDLTTPTPTEIAFFVPLDTPDPVATIPGKALVTGVALTPQHIVVTDVHSGLYVLARPPLPPPPPPPP
ncbi:MAG: hypothetical protein H0V45_08455, partial [Actinobacteria bacterium]|nr:hypothetical protein [Actinomycetota bacterium]